jgi:uncharacterized protein (UPF0332 family)
VRRLLGKELVKQGLLEKEWAMILAQEQDERALADYDVELTFPQEIAQKRVEEARRFLDRVREVLKEEEKKEEEKDKSA